MDYEEEWWKQNPCPILAPTVDACDLTPPYSRNTPCASHEEPGRMLSRGRQNTHRYLLHAHKISRQFGLQYNDQVENRTGYLPALVQLLCGIFSQGT